MKTTRRLKERRKRKATGFFLLVKVLYITISNPAIPSSRPQHQTFISKNLPTSFSANMTILSLTTLALMMAGTIHAATFSVPLTDAVFNAVIQVGVGEGTYSLVLDTSSANTVIGNTKPYQRGPNGVSTGNEVVVHYRNSVFSGSEYIDSVLLGQDTVFAQSFGVGTSGFDDADNAIGFGPKSLSTSTVAAKVDGALGLGPTRLSTGTVATKDEVLTVADNLYKEKTIPADLFAVFVQSGAQGVEDKPEISFGAVDATKYTGEIHFTPITESSPALQFWGIDAAFTSGNVILLSKTSGVVDLATVKLLLATDAFNVFVKQSGAILDATTGYWTLTSDQFALLSPVVLELNGVKIEIPANALIWPRRLNSQIGGSANAIYLIVGDLGTPSGQGLDFVIGYRVLKRFYTVFDAGNNQVGFATTTFTNDTDN